MRKGPIRVLIVDDSRTIQLVLKRILTVPGEIEVVGTASDGREGLDLVQRLDPDVVCTDLAMPGVDGFRLIADIMARHPRPILVISSLIGESDSTASFRALEAGAVDVLAKPASSAQMEKLSQELVRKVRIVAGVRVITRRALPGTAPGDTGSLRAASPASARPLPARPEGPATSGFRHTEVPPPASFSRETPRPAPPPRGLTASLLRRAPIQVVAIGASTGGPQALQVLLKELPATFPVPILCVQHISEGFLNGMVEWLDHQCALKVRIAQTGEAPLPGHVYFPQEETHLVVDRAGRLMPSFDAPLEGHRPSVTTTFLSVARHFAAASAGVLLTGMGRDGAEGMVEIQRAGGITIAQDEATSVVWGMPREAVLHNAARYTLPLTSIASTVMQVVTRRPE